MDVSAISQHDMEGGGIISVHLKVNFLFRDNVFRSLQSEPKPFLSISFSTVFLFNKIPNMSRAIPQGLV